MRLANRLQSIWMYGFPTRKHHYDRSFSRRQTSLDRYSAGNSITGDLKFTDGHSVFANHSPVKANYNATKVFSNGITPAAHKPLERTSDANGVRLSSRKNGFINFNNNDLSEDSPIGGYHSEGGYIMSDDTYYHHQQQQQQQHHRHNNNHHHHHPHRSRNKDNDLPQKPVDNVGGDEVYNFYQRFNNRQDEPATTAYYSNIYHNTNRWEHSPPPDLIEDMGYKPKPHQHQPVEPLDAVALPPAKARFDVIKTANITNSSSSSSSSSNNHRRYNNNNNNPIVRNSYKTNAKNPDDNDGITKSSAEAIMKAVKDEDIYAAVKMLENKSQEDVDINIADKSGRTILSHAVLKGNTPLVEKLLKIPQINVNKADNEGNTPLHFAVQAGQVEVVSLLLNCSPNLEIDARNHLGFTALMKAALQGRTKCAKMLIFAGASPTMRDTGRGLRAEQWARHCGRYVCADVIEKYARSQLLSKSTSYGNWGNEPEMGLHFINGKLQPSAVALQNAITKNHQQNNGLKSKLKRALHATTSGNSGGRNSKISSFSLVSQLTSAALCVSSPVLPNSSHIPAVVKSILKPFVIPRIEITSDECDSSETVSVSSEGQDQKHENNYNTNNNNGQTDSDGTKTSTKSSKSHRKLSSLVKFRKK